MTREDSLKNDMCVAEEHYSNVMKKWTRAYTKYKELDDEKMEAVQLLLDIRSKLEDMAIEDGTFHDQMVMDFDIDKYGKGKHFLENRREHNARWDLCSCYIQCPKCKKYNVRMEYKLMRNTFGGERIIFDVKVMDGERCGAYYYCEKCATEMGDNE